MSDKTLDQLIASLKSEAIEQAEKESAKILKEARSQAEKIRSEAKEQKATMLKEAEKEAQEIVDKGKKALQVAARDLSLTVRNELLELLKTTFEKEVRDSFDPDLMKSVINSIVENIGSEVELKLPEKDMSNLASYIQQRVQAADGSLTITEDNSLLAGMSITKKDQGWSYEITPTQITEALLPYLNTKWIQILTDETKA